MAEIVPFSLPHADAMHKIECESFPDPWSRQSFVDFFGNPLAVGFTAFENGELTGYLLALHIPPEIEILNLAVKKSCRRKNIATELFSALFDYAKAENAERLTLEVRPSNAAAVALYRKFGFALDGFRKNYYAHPKEDAALMSLRLR